MPPGTPAKDRMNVRLALAYADFSSWASTRRVEYHLLHYITCTCLSESISTQRPYFNKSIRHSQPEFSAKMLKDVMSGYAELSMKGHNAARQPNMFRVEFDFI